jgi:glycosyltransferase involved in cell wall biosynthesis
MAVLGEAPDRAGRKGLRVLGIRLFPSRRERLSQRLARILRAAVRGECIPAARYLSPRRVQRLVCWARESRPDVIVLGEVYQASLIAALEPLGARIIVDTHDAASRIHARIAAASRSMVEKAGYGLLAWNTRKVERRLLPRAAQLWVVSEEDARFYRESIGLLEVAVVPNVVEIPERSAPGTPESPVAPVVQGSVVFAGSFSYWPNEDAALRLVELTRPLAADGLVKRVSLVGVHPTERMRQASATRADVVVTGPVDRVEPYLRGAEVVAIPLAAGSGTKLKVLEAMALGRPVLTTPVGAEGLDVEPGVHLEVAPLDRFAAALAALLRDADRRRVLGNAGRAWVEIHASPAALDRRLRELLCPAREEE